ncbi:unnamed protein product [Lepeophtheirus salmonis]|uniref:(salmon louse) hypothetical protein n=1 Tax=Lepeophtheirus salmonis TaxID=72036 RepID=A0A7R8CEJ4_LEPSM|nr:unnamed protein product [Lepeophtheirus salmonis]CAF2791715.1 unnamed protein product [Lepeophtheirus salmonis]
MHYCSSSQYLEGVLRPPQKQSASGKTGKELNEEEMNMAMEYGNKKYPALVPIIMMFQARSPPSQPFKFTVYLSKTISATESWESHAGFMGSHCCNILSAVYQLTTAAPMSS